MDLKKVIRVQRDEGLGDVHVVFLGQEGYHLAHTDEERDAGTNTEACPFCEWLHAQSGPPAKPGFYLMVDHEVDAYSEPYPVARYDFLPLGPGSASEEDQ